MTIALLDFPGLRRLVSLEPQFPRALSDIAEGLRLDPNKILAVMVAESGLRPDAVNATSGASGLIQFMPATAQGLGTSVEAIRKMSGTEQLSLVSRYLRPHASRMKEVGDYYMAVFMPAFLGRPAETVLGVKDSTSTLEGTRLSLGKIYAQNAGLDVDKDGVITVGDVTRKVENILRKAEGLPAIAAPDVPLAEGRPVSSPPPSLPPPWRSSGGPFDLPVLRLGSKGSAVSLAQLLTGSDVVTGVFSLAFADDYVRPFQRKYGLKDDGVIGPVTWAELCDRLRP